MDQKQNPEEAGEPRQTLGSRQTAMRVVQVPFEGFVAVYEQDDAEGRALVFDSTLAIRRIREFPADWQRLGEAELLALRPHAE